MYAALVSDAIGEGLLQEIRRKLQQGRVGNGFRKQSGLGPLAAKGASGRITEA